MSIFNLSATSSDPLNAELAAIAARLDAVLKQTSTNGTVSSIEMMALQRCLTPLVKLYAAIVEDIGREPAPTDESVTPTEVVILACALLRVQNLNPFDLAIWFSRYPNPHVPTSCLAAEPRSFRGSKEDPNGNGND